MPRNHATSSYPVLGSRAHLFAVCILLCAFPARQGEAAPWQQYADAETVGWSAAKLDLARAEAESLGTAALMVVEGGHLVAAWGAVEHPFKTHSIRKSLYSLVLGAYWSEGSIRIDATLADLGIDDLAGLTANEASARVEDLLAARSGVYLPAAYEPESNADRRPARGSHPPGDPGFGIGVVSPE